MDLSMKETMRKAVTNVTNLVFPTPKDYYDVQRLNLVQTASENVSSLPLQMAIYFNMYFFPWWLITTIVMLEAKFNQMSSLYQIIVVAIVVIFTIIEVIRLYLGFHGNLSEKVPDLAGSWLLTIILQLPLILFLLLNEATVILPLERAVNIIMTAFIVSEVIIGFFAIRTMVHAQMVKFHLRQFVDLDHVHHEQFNNEFMFENQHQE